MVNYIEIVEELEAMEAKPWWHPHRWRLRWWDLTAPVRKRYWLWQDRRRFPHKP